MKKFLCLIISFVLVFSTTAAAQAKNPKDNCQNGHCHHQNICEENRTEFKLNEAPMIKYGCYKLPINPIEKGMGAKVTFNKHRAVLTVKKDTTTIEINFKKKTVCVNGTTDKNSGIFAARDHNKTAAMLKYIAGILGFNIEIKGNKVTITGPGQGLNLPSNVTVTPVGTVVIANTLNSTSTHLTASANITAGQAAGGRAELYVGSRLIAIDSVITASDTSVTFTTSDGSPTNAELQAVVPSGGTVSVKLYSANSNSSVSSVNNPNLTVDYRTPTISGISSAQYKPSEGKLIIYVFGAGEKGDMVDVTKLTFIDYSLGRTYQLTNSQNTGSSGKITGTDTLTITIGSADKSGLSGFTSASFYLSIAAGSLLKDAAGNSSPAFSTFLQIPVNAQYNNTCLDAPSNITLASEGTVEVPNTLNSTSIYFAATAKITPGQATGGKAELYVGSRLVATDNTIAVADNQVSFTTSDTAPTNAKLQSIVPSGGVVTVKLYNANGNSVTSTSNPTLTVDYIAPTLSAVSSAIYDASKNQLSLAVSGAGSYGDMVDVTKLSLYDLTLGKTYQLTNKPSSGSSGSVTGASSLIINIGTADKAGLAGFGTSVVYLTVAAGSLLKDAAGNTSPAFTSQQFLSVTVINNNTSALNAPVNVTVSPKGGVIVANTLNSTTLYMEASANITAGQAAGGKAELYVAGKLIATDSSITAADKTVTFTTSDGSPTNAEMQADIQYGGEVQIRLYNAQNVSAASTTGNPTLTVDYTPPTLTKIVSAAYDTVNGVLYLYVEGAGAAGDLVDVNLLSMYDLTEGKVCQLTSAKDKGSSGSVNSSNLLIIYIGSTDKTKLSGFGKGLVYLTIFPGTLLKDKAGNTSTSRTDIITIPVTIYK